MPKTKIKKPKLNKKLSFKNPALVIVIVLLVAAGVFFAFKTFAAGGVTSSGAGPKDQYGCPFEIPSRPTLREGSNGPCVKTLQDKLNYLYKGLSIDGVFGPITKNYVIFFQTQYRLSVDGIVGQQTWSELECRVGEKSGFTRC